MQGNLILSLTYLNEGKIDIDNRSYSISYLSRYEDKLQDRSLEYLITARRPRHVNANEGKAKRGGITGVNEGEITRKAAGGSLTQVT